MNFRYKFASRLTSWTFYFCFFNYLYYFRCALGKRLATDGSATDQPSDYGNNKSSCYLTNLLYPSKN